MLKLLGGLTLAAILTSGAALAAVAGWMVSGGVAVCDVDTPEVSLKIPVPTRLADVGLMVARFAVPAEELREIRREAAAIR